MFRSKFYSFVMAGILCFSIDALAHHGGAAYDASLSKTVTGKVSQFHFVNPHVLIYIEAEDENGELVEWSGELTSPNRLARMERGSTTSWSKDILKPGDEITLSGNPARSGAPSLRLRKVVDSNGEVLVGED
ncbi:MAG: DUF6152 family protein [Arenicellaceae bacterium]|nr:DUF6152 family protein [Arenicellaceae bacterium]